MVALSKARAWILSGCAALSLAAAFPVSARAEVLFDSLHSKSADVLSPLAFGLDATFATGASPFHATDIALLLNQVGTTLPGDTLNVTLVGGIPLSDVTFDPAFSLNVGPGLDGPIVGSAPLLISDLSSNLTVEHFNQFASIALNITVAYSSDL
jgi:hypothetical protein